MKYLLYFIFIAILTAPQIRAADTAENEIPTDILATYIEGAAKELGLSEMTAVGNVICNRIKSGHYPNSVIENGELLGIMPSESPSEMARFAAELSASGKDITGGATVFFPDTDKKMLRKYEKKITYSSSGIVFAKDR